MGKFALAKNLEGTVLAIICYANRFSPDLNSRFHNFASFVLWGAIIDSCSLRALLEYVDVSDESHVYIKHYTCKCNKYSVGQSVVLAQLHMCRKATRKKVCDFWLLPGEIRAQLLKKVG